MSRPTAAGPMMPPWLWLWLGGYLLADMPMQIARFRAAFDSYLDRKSVV